MQYKVEPYKPYSDNWVFIIESSSDELISITYSSKGNAERGLLRFLGAIVDDYGVKWDNGGIDLDSE